MFLKMVNLSANPWLYTFVLVTIISFHQANAAPRSVDSKPNSGIRITNGKIARIEDFPYQVAIWIGRELCGGSILNENHVLTAASCANSQGLVTVVSGTNDAKLGGSSHNVQKTTIHPGYGKPSQGGLINNIAILKVSPSFKKSKTTDSIEPYPGFGPDHVGREVTISGFGLAKYGGKHYYKLRSALGNIGNTRECSKMYEKLGRTPIGEDCFCANNRNYEQNVCLGDYGGPLVMNKQLIGFPNMINECGKNRVPTIFTNVTYYARWIKETISKV